MANLTAIFRNNDHVIELTDVKDSSDDSIISDATVSVILKTLVDGDGDTEVAGETWPLTMTAVVGTPGAYEATLDKALVLTPAVMYVAEITAFKGALDGFWEFPMQGMRRKS